ncbi:MAG TPA: DnaJ domain-containing protein [Bdellovibrionota bacterium]|nr:DnaJ domain-containing protein [Bdellovibrionota bacterium]
MKTPGDHDIPRIVRIDGLESIHLEPEEAFVFSRVDGKHTLGQIAKILSYDTARVWKLLSRLVDAGFIVMQAGKAVPRRAAVTQKKTILNQIDEDETDSELNKIPRDVRNDLLLRYEGLSRQTYYEVLGVLPNTVPEEIRKKYFILVKQYHPDRFFGQEIGHYGEKIDAVFGKITEAFEELSDEAKRKSYDRKLKEASKSAKDRKQGKGKEKKPDKTILTGTNLIERLALAKQHFKEAEKEEQAGNDVAAANLYYLAFHYDSQDKAHERAWNRMRPILQRHKAEDLFSRGMDALNRGKTAEATVLFEEVLQMNPRKKECYRELTRLYARNKASLDRAKDLGGHAVEFFPDDADLRATMGHVYKEMGQVGPARKEFKAALKLDKENEEARMGLAELGGK